MKNYALKVSNSQLQRLNEYYLKQNNISASKDPAQKKILEKMVQLIELLSKIIISFAVKIILTGFVLPKAVACFYVYFTTDSGNEAFELSLPMW